MGSHEMGSHEMSAIENATDSHRLLSDPTQRQTPATDSSPHHPRPDPETESKEPNTKWSLPPWTIELSAWIGSLVCFIAIIAVLAVCNDKPLPKLQFGATPAAIIGLLSTLFQTGVMVSVSAVIGQMKWIETLRKKPMIHFRVMDEASRGVLGSLKLLAYRKAGYGRYICRTSKSQTDIL